jgi:hypothetical protein
MPDPAATGLPAGSLPMNLDIFSPWSDPGPVAYITTLFVKFVILKSPATTLSACTGMRIPWGAPGERESWFFAHQEFFKELGMIIRDTTHHITITFYPLFSRRQPGILRYGKA